MNEQWTSIEAALRASIHTRNLEDIGCVVEFFDTATDVRAFAQVNYGNRIAYQGPADERYVSFAHGFTQAEWMLKTPQSCVECERREGLDHLDRCGKRVQDVSQVFPTDCNEL